jgi:hypothetical protein
MVRVRLGVACFTGSQRIGQPTLRFRFAAPEAKAMPLLRSLDQFKLTHPGQTFRLNLVAVGDRQMLLAYSEREWFATLTQGFAKSGSTLGFNIRCRWRREHRAMPVYLRKAVLLLSLVDRLFRERICRSVFPNRPSLVLERQNRPRVWHCWACLDTQR